MLFATLDQVVWLTSSEGLSPRVYRTKGALTKRILCPEWLSPCHRAAPHALSYTHMEKDWFITCMACILLCNTHVCFPPFYCTWKNILSNPCASWFMPGEKCPALKVNWLLPLVEHIWYLYQQDRAMSLISPTREGEIRKSQTLLGDTRCLRLTDRHMEIWDTHRPYARDQCFEMNTGTTHLKHGDVALQKKKKMNIKARYRWLKLEIYTCKQFPSA